MKPEGIYGYRVDASGHIEIVEDEARAIRRLFELHAKGTMPQREIAETLTREGHQSRYSTTWTQNQVCRAIKRAAFYRGRAALIAPGWPREHVVDAWGRPKQPPILKTHEGVRGLEEFAP